MDTPVKRFGFQVVYKNLYPAKEQRVKLSYKGQNLSTLDRLVNLNPFIKQGKFRKQNPSGMGEIY
jgi:hypothetical protein